MSNNYKKKTHVAVKPTAVTHALWAVKAQPEDRIFGESIRHLVGAVLIGVFVSNSEAIASSAVPGFGVEAIGDFVDNLTRVGDGGNKETPGVFCVGPPNSIDLRLRPQVDTAGRVGEGQKIGEGSIRGLGGGGLRS